MTIGKLSINLPVIRETEMVAEKRWNRVNPALEIYQIQSSAFCNRMSVKQPVIKV